MTEQIKGGKVRRWKAEAVALLELFLHGFMQERKEMEAAQND